MQNEEQKYELLEKTVKDTYARVVWTHKIQEKQGDIYAGRYAVMQTVQVVTTAITSAGIISAIFYDETWVRVISAVVSVVSLFISAYLKSFDLKSMTANHKTAANKLLAKRDQFSNLIVRIRLRDGTVHDLMTAHEKLTDELHSLYQECPQTTSKAVHKAGIALKIKNDNTFDEDELDKLLPDPLKNLTVQTTNEGDKC